MEREIMPGPVPKPASLRQRRNKAVTAAKLKATAPRRQRAPRLPLRRDPESGARLKWHPETRRWWQAVWHSPMASEYLEADIHALYRLAVLVDQFWREPSKELAAEIRLQQQCFGLTPIDRRRLQWEVERGEEAATRTQQRQVRRAQSGGEDPRQALQVLRG